ncbi:MAG: hypothetical protein K0Q95_2497 [Bacteroidota bacterium]|jgi:hypothetical protein|nr:hypothetical protein [Bacteroidota bacterium]
MNETTSRNLHNKLKSYSALAGTLFVAHQASSQIVYTDIIPDSTVNTDGAMYDLDLNNDGTFDFTFKQTITTYMSYPVQKVSVNALNLNEVAGSVAGAYIYPTAMNAGDTIQSSLVWNVGTSQSMASYFGASYSYGQWLGATDKYIPLKINVAGTIYYGWARLDVATLANSFTIKDYAYMNSPGQPILAGATMSVGIAKAESKGITVYNNNREIHINTQTSQGIVTITNALGQAVLSQQINSEQNIVSLETEKAGVYFVNVKSQQISYTKKIVIN